MAGNAYHGGVTLPDRPEALPASAHEASSASSHFQPAHEAEAAASETEASVGSAATASARCADRVPVGFGTNTAPTCRPAVMHPGVVTVNLDAIARNINTLRQRALGTELMAIVKADAYGHGLGPVSIAALEAGATWLGVAQVSEALSLRALLDQAGFSPTRAPILTWIATPGTNWASLITAHIDLAVSWTWVLDEICHAAHACGTRARIHIKVDTGMLRAGSTLEDLPALAQAAAEAQRAGLVEIVGLFSHLSRADEPTPQGEASTMAHIQRFCDAQDILRHAGIEPALCHLGASSGLLWHPDAHFDMVRPGIALYGLSPDPEVASGDELGLWPALRLTSQLTSVKRAEAGQTVSYGGTWAAPTSRWLGLIPLGYADGIPRSASNQGAWVLIETAHGPLRATQVGRICMDQFVVDLGSAERGAPAPAAVGDTVVLIGDTRRVEPSADDWARAAGTINYEIVTRLGDRLTRTWTRDSAMSDATSTSDTTEGKPWTH